MIDPIGIFTTMLNGEKYDMFYSLLRRQYEGGHGPQTDRQTDIPIATTYRPTALKRSAIKSVMVRCSLVEEAMEHARISYFEKLQLCVDELDNEEDLRGS